MDKLPNLWSPDKSLRVVVRNHNDSLALATAACLHREDRGHLVGFIR